MTPDVFFRNPEYYIREIVEIAAPNIAWDRGYLAKKNLDPAKFAELYYPSGFDWRTLVIGHQGTVDLRPGNTMEKPFAVYPTWQFSDGIEMLEEMIANEAGLSEEACSDLSVPPDERPVLGQPHVVVVTELPNMGTGMGRRMIKILAELQDEYEDVTIHVHALYSFRMLFGQNFKSVDVESRTSAQKGRVEMPYGKVIAYEFAQSQPQWVRLLGFSTGELAIPRNRCMYNMKAAVWAAKHWQESFNFRSSGKPIKVDSSAESHVPATTKSWRSVAIPVQEGDKIACDICSLSTTCKYFRVGSVCTVPGSETESLAGLFGSRDAEKIVDGLGGMLSKMAERTERAVEMEEQIGDIDPEVSKLLNTTFANGVKLAKLINPKLNGGVGININLPGAGNVPPPTPQRLMSEAIASLEAQGYRREDITPDLIARVLGLPQGELEAGIAEAEVVDDGS